MKLSNYSLRKIVAMKNMQISQVMHRLEKYDNDTLVDLWNDYCVSTDGKQYSIIFENNADDLFDGRTPSEIISMIKTSCHYDLDDDYAIDYYGSWESISKEQVRRYINLGELAGWLMKRF